MIFHKTLLCHLENDSLALGRSLGEQAFLSLVVCLEGGLGAGKTVFARGFAQGLGIREPVTSPSYPIIQEYQGQQPFYHMDFYRLADEADVLQTGAQELLGGHGICIVEWPGRAIGLFDEAALWVHISIQADQSRRFKFESDSAITWNRLGLDSLPEKFTNRNQ